MTADPARVAGLVYRDPPGGLKACRNSKLASRRVELEHAGERPVALQSARRAALELLAPAAAVATPETAGP